LKRYLRLIRPVGADQVDSCVSANRRGAPPCFSEKSKRFRQEVESRVPGPLIVVGLQVLHQVVATQLPAKHPVVPLARRLELLKQLPRLVVLDALEQHEGREVLVDIAKALVAVVGGDGEELDRAEKADVVKGEVAGQRAPP